MSDWSFRDCYPGYCHFLAYNDRAGYQLVTFQENGDWNVERFLLHPEIETFFQKKLYT